MIVGLVKSDEGSIHIMMRISLSSQFIKDLSKVSAIYHKSLSVFRDMTAKDNIEAILEVDKSLSRTEKSDILEHLIDKFDLSKFINTKGIQLSEEREEELKSHEH